MCVCVHVFIIRDIQHPFRTACKLEIERSLWDMALITVNLTHIHTLVEHTYNTFTHILTHLGYLLTPHKPIHDCIVCACVCMCMYMRECVCVCVCTH